MIAGLLAQIESADGAATDATRPEFSGGLGASPLVGACGLLAVGLWLSLPRGGAKGRRIGILFTVAAIGIIAWQLPPLVGWLDRGLFASFSCVAILSCVAAVVSRNPVYSAIWFGLALLGTSGLFLLTGAQFLSVATVTVYAGAILVTFLFAIMLAQPRGHTPYDRMSWEAFLSAAAGAILVGLLTSAIGRPAAASGELVAVPPAVAAVDREDAATHGILAENHVAHLGQELLGRHLISMQAAGALMFAALVGAVAIIAHGRKFPASIELASGRLFQVPAERRILLPAQQESPAQPESAGGIHA